MIKRLGSLFHWPFRRQDGPARHTIDRLSLAVTESCLQGVSDLLAASAKVGHEGIVYLIGKTDGTSTLAAAAFAPEARTTAGSFDVSAPAMALVVRAASDLGLQVESDKFTHIRTKHSIATATSRACGSGIPGTFR